MSILVSVVSHPVAGTDSEQPDMMFGFRALKPAIAIYPQFLEMLVSRLSSADHALCANALQLINSLMRDSITHDLEAEWPKFIQKLQDLGVIRAVYVLMQDSALQDLAHPLLEFQSLTKVLLRKWRDIPLNQEKPEHRRALKGIYLASMPKSSDEAEKEKEKEREKEKGSKKHHPEKWRRLGFETENPASEFHEAGFLGMMDLADYVRSHQDEFQKMLLEQSTKPARQRCPIAQASLAVTSILYEHFEVDKSEMDDSKTYMILESRSSLDKLFRPLLLHWTRLHVAGLQAFFRLWKATAAELEDLDKLVELIRILIESVVGGASRTKDVQDVEEDLANFEYHRLRELQMELLELTYEDAWGHHLRQVRDELQHEALQFVKEQRIRCLLQGAWFSLESSKNDHGPTRSSCQYVQLSHNRRYLHFGQFNSMGDRVPELDALPEKSTSQSHLLLILTLTIRSRPLHRLLGSIQHLHESRQHLICNRQDRAQTGIYKNHHPRPRPIAQLKPQQNAHSNSQPINGERSCPPHPSTGHPQRSLGVAGWTPHASEPATHHGGDDEAN
jgi:engulfment/cell motility protein 1